MPNIENIDRVIEHLRTLAPESGVDFNMNWMAKSKSAATESYGHAKADFTCGAVACIAGHACVVAGEWDGENYMPDARSIAVRYLGLDPYAADALFEPNSHNRRQLIDYNEVTIADAIHALKVAKSGGHDEIMGHWRKVAHEIKDRDVVA